jgi:hypothetical protein
MVRQEIADELDNNKELQNAAHGALIAEIEGRSVAEYALRFRTDPR